MTLILCTECNKQVSSNASTCPNCGNPVAETFLGGQQPVEIERTNYGVKLWLLFSWTTAIIGLINIQSDIGKIMLGLGVFAIIIGRIAGWLRNG